MTNLLQQIHTKLGELHVDYRSKIDARGKQVKTYFYFYDPTKIGDAKSVIDLVVGVVPSIEVVTDIKLFANTYFYTLIVTSPKILQEYFVDTIEVALDSSKIQESTLSRVALHEDFLNSLKEENENLTDWLTKEQFDALKNPERITSFEVSESEYIDIDLTINGVLCHVSIVDEVDQRWLGKCECLNEQALEQFKSFLIEATQNWECDEFEVVAIDSERELDGFETFVDEGVVGLLTEEDRMNMKVQPTTLSFSLEVAVMNEKGECGWLTHRTYNKNLGVTNFQTIELAREEKKRLLQEMFDVVDVRIYQTITTHVE